MAPTGNRFDRSGIVELQITDGVWMIRSCDSQCGVTIGGLVRGAQNLRPVLPAIGHQGAGVHSSASSAAVWNIKLVNNREQLSDNDDDCWELTPANVSWWKGVKAKYLLQLRPYTYNIFCFQWRLRWKKLCQTVGKFLNHKSMWDEIWVTGSVTTF